MLYMFEQRSQSVAMEGTTNQFVQLMYTLFHSHKSSQCTSNQSQDQETLDSADPRNQMQGPTQETLEINTTTTVSNERRSVLLQTAITTVQSSNGFESVTPQILFDSGNQCSYTLQIP